MSTPRCLPRQTLESVHDRPRTIRNRAPVAARAAVCRRRCAILDTYAGDPDVTRYLPWKPVASVQEVRLGTVERINRHLQGREYSWTIASASSGSLLGMITAFPRGLFVECGFALGRQYWGKGYATEALVAVADWASGQPDIFRLWACCDTDHAASGRVLEKAGFVRQGVLRKWRVHPAIGPEPRDCSYFVHARQAPRLSPGRNP